MSLVFLEGFDDGFYAERSTTMSGTVSGTGGRYNNGVRLLNGQIWAFPIGQGWASGSAGDEAWFGFAYRPGAVTANVDGYWFNVRAWGQTSGTQTYLRTSGSDILVYTTSGLVDTISAALTADEWAYWEIYIKSDNSPNGIVEVKKNGTQVSYTSSTDTAGTGYGFGMVYLEGGMYTGTSDYDDFYVCSSSGTVNNTYLGDLRVDALIPSGAGTYTQLTPSAGSNYENVDETSQDGDTTYNEHATSGNKDTYAYSNHPLGSGTIHGITLSTYARKTNTAAKSFRRVLRSNSTDDTGSDQSLGTGYALYEEVIEQDPGLATPAAWTITNLNAAEFGFEVRP